MNAIANRRDIIRDRAVNAGALMVLLAIGALALFGPSGVLAWGEDAALLEQHEAKIAQLQLQRDAMRNRVDLLASDNVDPDFASELVRGNLNVVHPDEYVIDLDGTP